MADFELEEDEYHLFFEDPKYDGFEVVAEGATLEECLEFDRIRRTVATTDEEAEQRLRALADFIGERLLSWNLTKKGLPVPCDAKGLMQQRRRGFLGVVIEAYAQALSGVPAPLALGSSDTDESSSTISPSEAMLSIPMEPLSESR
jgi:hypothetical protein